MKMMPLSVSMLSWIVIVVFVSMCLAERRMKPYTTSAALKNYIDNITFKFFKNNALVFESKSESDNLAKICNPADPWLMIVPGWTDDCSARTDWIPPLIEKFTKYRGGCLCCMDFYPFASDASLVGYMNLTSHFDGLSEVLYRRLQQFERQQFGPQRGLVFGHSFGSRVAVEAGHRFGGKMGAMDVCDPAGPLFYPNVLFLKPERADNSMYLAAGNVQSIHTSADEGTFERSAHQDWCMGDCGLNQAASPPQTTEFSILGAPSGPDGYVANSLYLPFSRLNHHMCPYFYIEAFEHRFDAIANPCCPPSDRDAVPVPDAFRMGYMQPDKGRVQQKTLYARTVRLPPYNVPK